MAATCVFQTGVRRPVIPLRGRDGPSRCAAALHAAARSGNTASLLSQLAAGASPNERGGDSRGPLHAAAQGGCLEAVDLLLRAGAEVDARSLWEITPLLEAAAEGHVGVAERLLAAGAAPAAAGRDGFSALHRAAEMGHTAVVELLLQQMPDADTRNSWGYTPLITASCKGHTAVVRALLRAGADPNVSVNHSAGVVTPLEGAVLQDYAGVCWALLEAGADPNRINPATGEAPLHMACAHFSRRCIQVLLQHGADETLRGGRNHPGGAGAGAVSAAAAPAAVNGLVPAVGPAVDSGVLPADVLGRNLRATFAEEEMSRMRSEMQELLASAPQIRRDARWARRGWLVALRALRLRYRLEAAPALAPGPVTAAKTPAPVARRSISWSDVEPEVTPETTRPAAIKAPAAASAPAMLLPSAGVALAVQPAPLATTPATALLASAGGSSPVRERPQRRPRREAVDLAHACGAAAVAVGLDDDELFALVVRYL